MDILCGYSLGSVQGGDGQPHLPANLCRAFSRALPVKRTIRRALSAALMRLPLWATNCNRAHDFGVLYPAASLESGPVKGTRAWIVVPPPGCDLTENSPFTNCSRSRMLTS